MSRHYFNEYYFIRYLLHKYEKLIIIREDNYFSRTFGRNLFPAWYYETLTRKCAKSVECFSVTYCYNICKDSSKKISSQCEIDQSYLILIQVTSSFIQCRLEILFFASFNLILEYFLNACMILCLYLSLDCLVTSITRFFAALIRNFNHYLMIRYIF